MAQDSGGDTLAGPFYDAAEATFTTLIDERHQVTALYGMVNVPTGVWIDEEGRIVRPPEIAYSREHRFGSIVVGDDGYGRALRDWVAKGEASVHVLSPEELARRTTTTNPLRPAADAHFQLAVHLHRAGEADAAAVQFREAQRLDPDNWNYHRQEWSFDPATAGSKWRAKVEALDGRPYYEPVDLGAGDD